MSVRFLVSIYFVTAVAIAATAADLTVTVKDPQSAVVSGAQVSIYPDHSSQAVAIRTTTAKGVVIVSGLARGAYHVNVMAAGFAPKGIMVMVPGESSVVVTLAVATVPQTVVVSATRTPLTEQDAGESMIGAGLRAKIACVDCMHLAADFVGREFDEKLLRDLPPEADPCGQYGEFHSCVYAGPMFRAAIPVELCEVVTRDRLVFADLLLASK